ncbi:unnamed protein product [[Candida] boidinii]|nr:unnamed protein product [[Candida] boidinii]
MEDPPDLKSLTHSFTYSPIQLNGVQVGSRLIRVDHVRYKPTKEAETEEEEFGEVGNNLAKQYLNMVDDELKILNLKMK